MENQASKLQGIKLAKRSRADDELMQQSSELGSLTADHDITSVDNNTNFDWLQKKKWKRKQEEGEDSLTYVGGWAKPIDVSTKEGAVQGRISSKQFFGQSLFYVETLQPEFCHVVGDNWIQFNEPVPLDFIEESHHHKQSSDDEKKEGRWTSEEHSQFLEALRFFGKDWDKIQKHIGTKRSLMSIRAHAQNFLVRLVRMLEKNKTIKGLSQEEANYYHGVLSKKQHSSTRERIQRDEEAMKRAVPKQIFKIEKMDQQLKPVPEADARSEGRILSEYEKWREGASQARSKKSMFFSIKARVEKLEQSLASFSFKPVIQFSEEKEDDGDSVDSQSKKHLLKFDLDEYYNPDFFELIKDFKAEADVAIDEFYTNYFQQIYEFGDLPTPDTLMISQIGDGGPMFSVTQTFNKYQFLSEMYLIYTSEMIERLPNLYNAAFKTVQSLMDEMSEFNISKPEYHVHMTEMDKFIYSFVPTKQGREDLLNLPIHLQFMTPEEWQVKQAELAAKRESSSKEFMTPEEAFEMVTGARRSQTDGGMDVD